MKKISLTGKRDGIPWVIIFPCSFESHIRNLCKNASQKLLALARVALATWM